MCCSCCFDSFLLYSNRTKKYYSNASKMGSLDFVVYIVYHNILGLGIKIICFCNLERLVTVHKLNVL